MWRPVDQGDKRLPLMIFNRGGNTNFGRVPPWHGFHRLAAEGFVVLASQYRSVDGGEGVEENVMRMKDRRLWVNVTVALLVLGAVDRQRSRPARLNDRTRANIQARV